MRLQPDSDLPNYTVVGKLAGEAVLIIRGDPPQVVASVNPDFRRVRDRPETVRRLAGIGFEAKTTTPEAFGAFIRDEIARRGRMARAAGIKPA